MDARKDPVITLFETVMTVYPMSMRVAVYAPDQLTPEEDQAIKKTMSSALYAVAKARAMRGDSAAKKCLWCGKPLVDRYPGDPRKCCNRYCANRYIAFTRGPNKSKRD